MQIFGETIYDELLQHLLQEEAKFCGHELGKPTDVYKDGYVLFVLSQNVHIKKDDYLAGHDVNEFVLGKIIGIQINGIETDEVSEDSSIEVGLRTDCPFKKTHKLSVITKEKEVLL